MPSIKNQFHLHSPSPPLVKITIEQFPTSQPKAESSWPPLSSQASLTYQSQHCYRPHSTIPPIPEAEPREGRPEEMDRLRKSRSSSDCANDLPSERSANEWRRQGERETERETGHRDGSTGGGKGVGERGREGRGCHGTWRWNDK